MYKHSQNTNGSIPIIPLATLLYPQLPLSPIPNSCRLYLTLKEEVYSCITCIMNINKHMGHVLSHLHIENDLLSTDFCMSQSLKRVHV